MHLIRWAERGISLWDLGVIADNTSGKSGNSQWSWCGRLGGLAVVPMVIEATVCPHREAGHLAIGEPVRSPAQG